MSREDFDPRRVQDIIGYNFKNEVLLRQAFTRRSFSQENPDFKDNEILEFYGDAALNLYVSRAMCEEFGKIEKNQFESEKNEGELSKIRSWNVNKGRLSHCIEILGLEKYLFLGLSDIKNEIWKSHSVKEDLFEAIVGAVAIDSGWNLNQIKVVCQGLFSVDGFSENYIKLLEEECRKHGWEMSIIFESKNPFEFLPFNNAHNLLGLGLSSLRFDRQEVESLSPKYYSIHIRNLRTSFLDYSSKGNTMLDAAKKVYEWILRRDKTKQAIGNIDKNLAVNQLHELWQKKLIEEPVYTFVETHDENGNPIWLCSCKLAEEEFPFEARNVSKRKAKQEAAYQALYLLQGEEIKINRMEGK